MDARGRKHWLKYPEAPKPEEKKPPEEKEPELELKPKEEETPKSQSEPGKLEDLLDMEMDELNDLINQAEGRLIQTSDKAEEDRLTRLVSILRATRDISKEKTATCFLWI